MRRYTTIEFAQALQTVLEYRAGPFPSPRAVRAALKVVTLILYYVLYAYAITYII